MNLTIRQNAVTVWAGAEPTQTRSGVRSRYLSGFFTSIDFFYGRVVCNYKIPFEGKLQASLLARVQAPDHPFIEPKGNTNQEEDVNMSNLLSIPFNNSTLVQFNTDGYLNATSIASSFGKKAVHYLRNETTQNYIKALVRIRTFEENQLVVTKKGSSINGGGTWIHPKLAIDFARWLSPEFAVWCDEQIEKILNKQSIDLPVAKSNLANAPQNLSASRSFALALMENGARKYDEITSAYSLLLKNLEVATENLNKVIGQVNHVKKMIHHIDHNDGAVHDGFAEARLYLFMDEDIRANAKPIAQKLYKPLDFTNI